jgi:hypothetical protein
MTDRQGRGRRSTPPADGGVGVPPSSGTGGGGGYPPHPPSLQTARDPRHCRELCRKPRSGKSTKGGYPPSITGRVGGLPSQKPKWRRDLPHTPLPRNGNCAILHASRACPWHEVSDGTPGFGGYSKMIRGGSDPAGEGEGYAGYLPPVGVGGSRQIKK